MFVSVVSVLHDFLGRVKHPAVSLKVVLSFVKLALFLTASVTSVYVGVALPPPPPRGPVGFKV